MAWLRAWRTRRSRCAWGGVILGRQVNKLPASGVVATHKGPPRHARQRDRTAPGVPPGGTRPGRKSLPSPSPEARTQVEPVRQQRCRCKPTQEALVRAEIEHDPSIRRTRVLTRAPHRPVSTVVQEQHGRVRHRGDLRELLPHEHLRIVARAEHQRREQRGAKGVPRCNIPVPEQPIHDERRPKRSSAVASDQNAQPRLPASVVTCDRRPLE
jgi:hypothetical protein